MGHFTVSGDIPVRDEDGTDRRENDTPAGDDGRVPLRMRSLVAGVVMGVLAIAVVLTALVLPGVAGGQVRDEDDDAAFALRERISVARAKSEALPAAQDAERGLTVAHKMATEVADRQDDYRWLAARLTDDGEVDTALGAGTRRNLVPYFETIVDRDVFDPWYLLDADRDVPVGIGSPVGFDSGFTWQAQMPVLINDDGTVPVTWLAVETRTGDGAEPAVLAWAQADYDLTRRVFMHVTTGVTVTGEGLQLEVRA